MRTRRSPSQAARSQGAWLTDYLAFAGGIDQRASGFSVKSGRLAQCLNMEEVFGYQGYRFVKGYERYDGYTNSPSRARYGFIPFINGNTNATPTINGTVDDGGADSARYVATIVESGSLAAGTAAGYVIIYTVAAAQSLETLWQNGNPIRYLGTQFATASGDSGDGSVTFTYNQVALKTLRDYFRSQILKPLAISGGSVDLGSGAILGGCIFQGFVWCVRNVLGDTTATLFRSSGAGWFAVRTGLQPSTKYRFYAANFTGDPSKLNLYMVNGKDRLIQISSDLSSTTKAVIFGSEATSVTVNTIGAGVASWVVAEASRSWLVGDDLTVWVDNDASKWMRGLVTAYNSGTNTVTINVTTVGGAGAGITNWEIGRSDFADKPFLVREHKNHLWLGYPRGQLQTSNLGAPMTFSGTATLFGLGQNLTGLSSLKGKALGVFCDRKIDVISGSSSADWVKEPYATEYGAVLDTVADNDGNPIFLTATGITTLQATQNFGSVEARLLSRDAKKLLDAKRSLVVAGRMALGNCQYRLYFSDGTCLRATLLDGGTAPASNNVSFGYSVYNVGTNCVWQGMMVGGEERMFYGASTGYVMEEDVGTSFDGTAVDYAFRTVFHHFKSPAVDKQLHKLELEVSGSSQVALSVAFAFDYDDGENDMGGVDLTAYTPGAILDVDTLDAAFRDFTTVGRLEAEVDGLGRNVSMIVSANSDFADPLAVQGALMFFSKTGVART